VSPPFGQLQVGDSSGCSEDLTFFR